MIETPSRGLFVATAAGRKLLADAPSRIDTALLRARSPASAQMLEADSGQPAVRDPDKQTLSARETTPTEQIADAVKLLRTKLKEELREHIRSMGHRRFERLIRDLLVAMEYGADADTEIVRSGGSDGGIDGVIHQDKLGLDRIYLQAKLYSEANVGRPAIQAFVGSLLGHGATKGVFVTMTGFSREAEAYAAALRERVVLIDGDRLCDLLIDHGVGVRDDRPLILKQIDLTYFADEG